MKELTDKAQQLIRRARALESEHPELKGDFDAQILALEELLSDGSAQELTEAVTHFEAILDELEQSIIVIDGGNTAAG